MRIILLRILECLRGLRQMQLDWRFARDGNFGLRVVLEKQAALLVQCLETGWTMG